MGYEVDFLPVGDESQSGDAIALRFGNLSGARDEQFVAVIDGGFAESGEALVKHVKDRYGTGWVDLVVSTHPDADHANGLATVLEELDPLRLWMHQPWNHTDDIARMFRSGRVTDASVRRSLRKALDNAKILEEIANRDGIPIDEPFAGRRIDAAGGGIVVLGPSEPYYESLLLDFRGTPEPARGVGGVLGQAVATGREVVSRIAETFNLETLNDEGETSAENNSSVVLLVSCDGRNLLFTGDAGMPALTHVADLLEEAQFDFETLKFVQVPHHGSKRNVGPMILDRLVGSRLAEEARLRSAFVSVAKNGAPKHPSKSVTNAFRRRGAPVHATQGSAKWHYYNAPDRGDYSSSEPLPLFESFEE